MKKQTKLIVLLSILINFSCAQENVENKIHILNCENDKIIGVDSANYSRFFNQYLSYTAGHVSSKTINGQFILAGLNLNNDSLILFNTALNTIQKIHIPFKRSLNISRLYFHNYDSIFVFLDRAFVRDLSLNKDSQIADFFLVDNSGKIVNSYSLNEVPNIDNKIDSDLVILNKTSVNGNNVVNGKLILPFYVFIPDEKFRNNNTKLFCEYDLRTKTYHMLDISVPRENYVVQSDSSVLMVPSFFFQGDSCLVYSFRHSPTIYQYNLKTDNAQIMSTGFPLNKKLKGFRVMYNTLEFLSEDKLCVRNITIKSLNSNQSLYFVEVLDSNFKSMGYIHIKPFELSLLNWDGYLATKKLLNNKMFVYHVFLENDTALDVEEFEKVYFKPSVNPKSHYNTIVNNSNSFNSRLLNYSDEMLIQNNERIITINIDYSCRTTLSFLINQINHNKDELSKKRFRILFYSKHAETLDNFRKKYESIKEFMIFDTDRLFLKYFDEKEYETSRVFIKKNGKIVFTRDYSCEAVETVFNQLMRFN